jgi:hypothetical protein
MGFFESAQTAWMCHDRNVTVCALGPSIRTGQTAATGAMARSLNRRGRRRRYLIARSADPCQKALS